MFADFKSTAILPVVESAVAEVIGRGAAIRLSRRMYFMNPQKSGRWGARGVLYVPLNCSDEFVRKVGNLADAEALIERFRGESLELSGCNIVLSQARDHAIRFLHRKGACKREITKVTGMTERSIRRICAQVPVEEKASNEFLAPHFFTLYVLSAFMSRCPLTGNRKYAR